MGPPIIPHLKDDVLSTPAENQSGDFIWTWQESLLVIPLGLIVIGTIFGNFLVLYAAVTRSKLRLPTHFIIANLALADFLVGVLVMPFLTVLQVTGRWYFGSVYCEAWTVIHFWLCAASILSTCAVCIERYIGVRYSLSHKTIMNTNRIWGLILCVWVVGGLLAFGSLYIFPHPKSTLPYVCPINQEIGHVIVAVVGILYIPATIMIILYLKIYMIATKHMNLMRKSKGTTIKTPSNSSGSSQHKGLLATFFKKNPNLDSTDPKRTNVPEQESSEQESSTTEVSLSFGTTDELDNTQPNDTIDNEQKKRIMSATGSAPSTTSCSTTKSIMKNVQCKKEIVLAKRLSLLVGILLAAYLPFFTLYMVMAFKPGSVNIHVFQMFGWIRYSSSGINPFIYAFAVPAYRMEMIDIINKGIQRFKR